MKLEIHSRQEISKQIAAIMAIIKKLDLYCLLLAPLLLHAKRHQSQPQHQAKQAHSLSEFVDNFS